MMKMQKKLLYNGVGVTFVFDAVGYDSNEMVLIVSETVLVRIRRQRIDSWYLISIDSLVRTYVASPLCAYWYHRRMAIYSFWWAKTFAAHRSPSTRIHPFVWLIVSECARAMAKMANANVHSVGQQQQFT